MLVNVFASPVGLFKIEIVEDFFHIVRQGFPFLLVHDDGEADDWKASFHNMFAINGVVHVFHDFAGGDDTTDDAFVERIGNVGLRHGDRGRAKQFEGFKTRSRTAERGVLKVGDIFDRRVAHDDAGRAGEGGKDFRLFKFFWIFLLEEGGETMAGGLGVREEMREIRGFGDGETAGLVAHGEIADGGSAVRDAVIDGFRAEQCAARIGLDADTAVRATFHFFLPAFHLDAGESFRRREICVA